jgi:hypothetical protein
VKRDRSQVAASPVQRAAMVSSVLPTSRAGLPGMDGFPFPCVFDYKLPQKL